MPRPPSPGGVTSEFGWRIHPITRVRTHHNGQDRGWGRGATLVAPESGRITFYGYNPAAGFRFIMVGDSGTQHSLAHTVNMWPGLAVGSRVSEGQPVAMMGATGAAVGVHVHWEVTQGGKLIDPRTWLYQFAGTAVTPISPAAPPAPKIQETPDMHLIQTVDGTIGLLTDRGYAPISNMDDVEVFTRILEAHPKRETINQIQLTRVLSYIAAASRSEDTLTPQLLQKLDQIQAGVNADELAGRIGDAVAAAVTAQGVTVDVEPILAAVREGVASINANIDDQPTEFTIKPA